MEEQGQRSRQKGLKLLKTYPKNIFDKQPTKKHVIPSKPTDD